MILLLLLALAGCDADSVVAPAPDSAIGTDVAYDTSGTAAYTGEAGGVAELPRVFMETRYVEPAGKLIRVARDGDLQAAIDAAHPGDIIELAANGVYHGPFVLRAKGSSQWIVIRSSRWRQLPAEGTRVQPTQGLMPQLVGGAKNAPVIRTEPGASRYRLVGLDVRLDPAVTYTNAIIQFGQPGQTIATMPHHLVIDRSYVHGHAGASIQRCLMMNSAWTAVIDSYFEACHGKGYDSQAIVSWDGTGPFKIVNNRLEGAGENVMFGGATPSIQGLIPSDIEIRRNHFIKPLEWVGVWTVKNLFEVKNGSRILVEGNIFENNWPDAQNGVAILLMSVNEAGSCGWCVVEDLTFRYNIVKNSVSGITVTGLPQGAPMSDPPVNKRIHIAHNLLEEVGSSTLPNVGQFRLFGVFNGPEQLTIDHNTVYSGRVSNAIIFSGRKTGADFRFTNNILYRGTYGVIGDGSLVVDNPAEGANALKTYQPGYIFAGNVIVMDGTWTTRYPAGNYLPPSMDTIGFDGYALSSSSRYVGKATDGTDPGADIDRLLAHTSGVVEGTSGSN